MQQATSTTFVIFGITGDLAHRKLIPALFDVIAGRESPVRIVGVSSRPIGDDGVREIISKSLANHGGFAQDVGSTIAEATHCHVPRNAEDLAILEERLNDVESGRPANRVFYLGVPPDAAAHTATMIGMARLADGGGWGRIVVEKPFGRDGVSAALLNTLLHTHFSEDQIYRMDHYLGKEAVQNLLTFRFANPLFESTWNRDRIESVQIQVTETLGVGSRAGYYDGAGIVRDMVQNHLTQLVALVAMEAPSSFTAEAIRNAKVGVLQSIRTVSASDVTFGQYTAGSINGIAAAGYTDEPGVDSESHTATYIRLKLSIDTWRWQGVPFYLSTGKRLDEHVSTIVVT
ncbi:MAG: glucose-6-phosphate dehydrogenase (NADP(+)), partial [Acidobacteria bacterium]|nr:glucose-6-phosphate dehydrogenase (NADP(+)) [Acidobacteriota bacterium]